MDVTVKGGAREGKGGQGSYLTLKVIEEQLIIVQHHDLAPM
jgi:hypothetical protein